MQQNLFTEDEITTVSPAIAKPFVSRSTFYQGDCLVEMDKIADKSIDMILCDLPYGTTACKWDSIIPFEPLWKHYNRIAKDNAAIVLTASIPFTIDLINSNRKMFKYWWIWDKVTAMGFLNAKKQPLRQQEEVCVFYRKQPTYNPQLTKKDKSSIRWNNTRAGGNLREDVYRGMKQKNRHDSRKIPLDMAYPKNIISITNRDSLNQLHPTQKPVSLMQYLILTYTNEGETVLDNCMGSGTTGVACKKTGRHFIGIEKDPKYFEIAIKRVAD